MLATRSCLLLITLALLLSRFRYFAATHYLPRCYVLFTPAMPALIMLAVYAICCARYALLCHAASLMMMARHDMRRDTIRHAACLIFASIALRHKTTCCYLR